MDLLQLVKIALQVNTSMVRLGAGAFIANQEVIEMQMLLTLLQVNVHLAMQVKYP